MCRWPLSQTEISRENHYLLVMGKLKRGVTLEAANAEMTVIAKQLVAKLPEDEPRSHRDASSR